MARPTKAQLAAMESRPIINTQDAYSQAVANKQMLDNAMRIAVDNATKEIGVERFTCYRCGTLYHRDLFFKSSDHDCVTGVTRICRKCAEEILYKNGEPSAESLYEVLEYLDYPWIYSVYNDALNYTDDSNILDRYVKALAKNEIQFYRFKDSEDFTAAGIVNVENSSAKAALAEEYAFNRRDVIRLVGYDPFENYPIEEDKIQLYAQLLNFIDEETKNDGMKMSAVIQIVKKLNQAEKMNTQIDYYVNDIKNVAKNMVLIDRMSSASQKLMNVANSLAKDNGISVNFNNNKSAGASTLSGKIKKLNEIGLRSAKINSFDIGTCEGMRQVAEISEEARHKRIGYDENIAAEIKDIKVELVEQMTKERDEAKELARKLILENRDLKDFLKSQGLIDEKNRVIEHV